MLFGAVDIGTSTVKCAVLDENGTFLWCGRSRIKRAENPNRQNPEEWWDKVSFLLRDEMPPSLRKELSSLTLTGNMHALLGIDQEGKAVEDAVLWSEVDAGKEAEFLNDHFKKSLLESTGNIATPVFTLPKLLKMKEERPSLYKKSRVFLQSKDYILWKLTGKFLTDPSDASGVLLMDLSRNSWNKELMEALELDEEKFPPVIPSSSIAGKVTLEAAKITGLAPELPIVAGCGDLASAALGSHVDEKTFSLTLGTAGQLLGAGKDSKKALGGKLFIFAHADPSLELYLGSVPSGGFSFEFLSNLASCPIEEFFRLAGKAPISRDLPLYIPYILGKGAPSMDYTPNGGFLHIKGTTTREEMARGAVCGALFPLYECALLMEEFAGKRENILLQALAARVPAVRECACALFSQKKFLGASSEASLLGAGIIGAAAMGCYKDLPSAMEKMIRKEEVPSGLKEEQEEIRHLYDAFLAGKRFF